MSCEVVGVFVLIASGTLAFSYHEHLTWLAPFVLLASALSLVAAHLWKQRRYLGQSKKDDDAIVAEPADMLPAGVVWIVWLIYGDIFRGVAPLVSGFAAYVHGTLIVLLVLISHSRSDIRRDGGWATFLICAVGVLLFIPHPDTVSQRMPFHVLFVKVFLFYSLFSVSDTATRLEFDARRRADDPPTGSERACAMQIKIVQSAWVLLSLFPLTAVAVLQFLLLFREIRRHTRYTQQRRRRRNVLPVHNGDVARKNRPRASTKQAPPVQPPKRDPTPPPPRQSILTIPQSYFDNTACHDLL
jgi:uncharacterized membrane protein